VQINSSYEKELELHISKLEGELQEQKHSFHIPVPEDTVIVKEDYNFITGRILSYNRDLVKAMDAAGLIKETWSKPEQYSTVPGALTWIKTYVSFTIPANTKLSVVCYEVKKRMKKENYNQNFIKFSILEMPNVPNATKKTLRLTLNEVHSIKAELISKGEVF
jgi:hypothetical protein